MQFFRRVLNTLQASRSRRGTVLLLALGVLGILSVSALAYVTIVRLERNSSAATSQRFNFQQQVDIVVGEVQALLAADLFGNKIVTNDVPTKLNDSSGGGGERAVWPTMFEDAETWDSPSIDLRTFTSRARPVVSTIPANDPSSLPVFARADPDDAWLASTEPDWQIAVNTTDAFPQLTNLNSAYRYDAGVASNPGDDRWVRGHGRFVDLARWFLNPDGQNADPSLNLVDWENLPNDQRRGPREGNFQTADVGPNADEYRSYDRQMNALSTSTFGGIDGPILPSDERFWADTDGDLRPDARWTVLDSLGNRGGLNWVVAARIVDASALVNINSSIEFGGSGAASPILDWADGSTPADVDLVRLIKRASNSNAYVTTPRTDLLFSTDASGFFGHLVDGLGLQDIFEELETNNPLFAGTLRLNAWTDNVATLSRAQREQFWRNVGGSPLRPNTKRARGYPNRDLVDLHAFHATNNLDVVSRVEQFIDGPESSGMLPPAGPEMGYGPLRSREPDSQIRRLVPESGDPALASPTLTQIRDSSRRFLTTINGSGTQSPVPVLQRDVTEGTENPYRGSFRTDKIQIGAGPLTGPQIQQAFESFVWALAPLATDQAVHPNFQGDELGLAADDITGADPAYGDNYNYHYGGDPGTAGERGPAWRLFGYNIEPIGTPAEQSGATFALVTSAALAVNLADAIDPTDEPSVMALRNWTVAERDNNLGSAALINDREFHTQFRHGDIPTANVQEIDNDETSPEPWLVVGLERQPYLREVLVAGFYRETPGAVGHDGNIGSQVGEAKGFVVAIDLTNPWSTEVDLSDYVVVIPQSNTVYGDIGADPLGPVVLPLSNTSGDPIVMPPGATRRVVFASPRVDADPDWDLVDPLLTDLYDDPGTGTVETAIDLTDVNARRLHRMTAEDPSSRPVLLFREHDIDDYQAIADGDQPPFPGVLVDRLSPPTIVGVSGSTSGDEAFPGTLNPGGGAGGFNIRTETLDNYTGVLDNAYFTALGYDQNNGWEPSNTATYHGQVLITSSLQRPHVQGAASSGGAGLSGFGSIVLEFGPIVDNLESPGSVLAEGKNELIVRRQGQGWLTCPDPLADCAVDPATIPLSSAVRTNGITDLVTPPDVAGTLYDLVPDTSDLGVASVIEGGPGREADENLTIPSGQLAAFQLFIPNTPLRNPAEVLMLAPAAHLCRECDPLSETSMQNFTRWLTAGEWLARTSRLDMRTGGEGGSDDPVANPPNPSFASLDVTRFVPGQMGGAVFPSIRNPPVNALPDTMALPLALRVPDCFEALSTPRNDPLIQGRININTAPAEVLQSLPMVNPGFPVTIPGATLVAAGASDWRDAMMRDYRSQKPGEGPTLVNPPIGIFGLRAESTSGDASAVRARRAGFVTPAETAILGSWDTATGRPLPANVGTFLELGADTLPADNSPLQLDLRAAAFPDPTINPIDDTEERLALYRAVSNIATTRSDIYLAYFVLRGYDPQIIEQVLVGTSGGQPTVQQALDAMDNPDANFAPTYESRWLLVLDRSQTEGGQPLTRPTDRPRVLMRVELPRVLK